MVSIQGLPQIVPARPQKARKPKGDGQASETITEPNQLAKAVSQGIRNPELAGQAHQHIQYDLPDGRGRNALASYMDVLHQAKREELAALVGVDVYV